LPVVPAARVIGKGGASIRAIRDKSNATVRILQKELPWEMRQREDRLVVIDGEPAAVEEAVAAVLERVFDRSGLPEGVGVDRRRDRAHVVEVVVPEKSGSHIIGQRGERIKGLIEETGCDLHVAKEPMVGFADQKRVRVTGDSVGAAAGAVVRLQEVLGELAAGGVLKPEHFELREAYSMVEGAAAAPPPSLFPAPAAAPRAAALAVTSGGNGGGGSSGTREVPIRLLFSQDEAAWIVGKRGNKIMRLRELAKVQMNDADSPPFDESERVVEVATADLERRARVVGLILEDLALRKEGAGELRLLVPTELFGSVMGHRGETIRGIMQRTGANLRQHRAEQTHDGREYRLRLIEVIGKDHERIEAVRHVHHAIESRGREAVTAVHGGAVAPLGLSPTPAPRSGSPGAGRDAAVGVPAFPLWDSGATASAPSPTTNVVAETGSHLTLQLAMPSDEVARQLANESSGIAWRAGVQLSVGRGAGGVPILQVAGTAVGNSVACYLIQDRLFMMH